jgi:hypothetical protein
MRITKTLEAQLKHADKCEWCRLRVRYNAFPRMCDEWYKIGAKKKRVRP